VSWGTIHPATEVLAHNLIDRCRISPVRERNDRAIRALNDDRSILPAGRLRGVDCVKGVAPDNPVGSGGRPSPLGAPTGNIMPRTESGDRQVNRAWGLRRRRGGAAGRLPCRSASRHAQLRTARGARARQALPIHRPPCRSPRHPRVRARRLFDDAGNAGDRRDAGAAIATGIRPLRAVKSSSRSQWNAGFSADSGPFPKRPLEGRLPPSCDIRSTICSVRFTEPCNSLLASPFRPRLGVRCGWSPFPKDSSHGQTTG
jgi:hypothetical protein